MLRHDDDYEESNIEIPREIAKVCARKKKEGTLKRFIHFSAAGASPDAISRRLRTKWQGEEEVKKYFPEVTIIRPTHILANQNANNFLGFYVQCWLNNNGTMLLVDKGQCKRQPVLDWDIASAIGNMLIMDESRGQTYELGGPHVYTMQELLEFCGNALNHRPRYIDYSFEDFMKLNIGPNFHMEKVINWLIARPDYSAELRADIIVNKRDGVKTFEDLHIKPVATHHFLYDHCNFMLERLATENYTGRDADELDADDDGHH